MVGGRAVERKESQWLVGEGEKEKRDSGWWASGRKKRKSVVGGEKEKIRVGERGGERGRGMHVLACLGVALDVSVLFTLALDNLWLRIWNRWGVLLEGAQLDGVLETVGAEEAVTGSKGLGFGGVKVSRAEPEFAFD